MSRFLLTTKDRGLDRTLDDLERRLRALEGQTATTTVVQQVSADAVFASIVVQESDGAPYLVVGGLEFDQADGFVIAQNGDNAKVDFALLTTKGDLFTYSTANARLAVGTNGYALTPDSAQATGLRWAQRFNFARLTAGNETLTADTVTEYLRVFDDAGTGRTLTLPAPATHLPPIRVRALNAPAGGHTLARNGAESIDGAAANITMGTVVGQTREITLISDGTNWYSTNRQIL